MIHNGRVKFEKTMREGTILKRYKRFLADVRFAGESGVEVVHVPNTGSMKTCWEPGQTVLCSDENNPKRKLRYTLQMVHNGESWIMVNTSLTNALAAEAVGGGVVEELVGYDKMKREVKTGDSRIDLLLEGGRGQCYVEVKNVTLKGDGGAALFPDAVSTRGQKHLRELMALKESGHRACMLYIVSREDVDFFAPAAEIDPDYATLLLESHRAGVEILAYQGQFGPTGAKIVKGMDVRLA